MSRRSIRLNDSLVVNTRVQFIADVLDGGSSPARRKPSGWALAGGTRGAGRISLGTRSFALVEIGSALSQAQKKERIVQSISARRTGAEDSGYPCENGHPVPPTNWSFEPDTEKAIPHESSTTCQEAFLQRSINYYSCRALLASTSLRSSH
ncbi:hypothetical protein KM043_014472 [Ampulex compressa]|nr:hypothetical protein KM043_014472 [Ampulex compressa]